MSIDTKGRKREREKREREREIGKEIGREREIVKYFSSKLTK